MSTWHGDGVSVDQIRKESSKDKSNIGSLPLQSGNKKKGLKQSVHCDAISSRLPSPFNCDSAVDQEFKVSARQPATRGLTAGLVD